MGLARKANERNRGNAIISWSIVALFITYAFPEPLTAQSEEDALKTLTRMLEKGTLKNLDGVSIRVERFSPDASKIGLTQSSVLDDVELELRRSRIRIIPDEEETRFDSTIYVNIAVFEASEIECFVYSISIELKDWVTIERNGRELQAVTWSRESIGMARESKALNAITESNRRLLVQFMNAYLDANSG